MSVPYFDPELAIDLSALDIPTRSERYIFPGDRVDTDTLAYEVFKTFYDAIHNHSLPFTDDDSDPAVPSAASVALTLKDLTKLWPTEARFTIGREPIRHSEVYPAFLECSWDSIDGVRELLKPQPGSSNWTRQLLGSEIWTGHITLGNQMLQTLKACEAGLGRSISPVCAQNLRSVPELALVLTISRDIHYLQQSLGIVGPSVKSSVHAAVEDYLKAELERMVQLSSLSPGNLPTPRDKLLALMRAKLLTSDDKSAEVILDFLDERAAGRTATQISSTGYV